MTGINVQLGTLRQSDIPDLRRFDSCLLIVDWPEHLPDTLAVLDAAGVAVGLWRFTQDPRGWSGWPGEYVKRCDLALFANEPDVEGWPDWYSRAVYAWYYAKGRTVSPAWSDESKRQQVPGPAVTTGVESVLSAHVYPLGRGAANLAAVRAWANGGPVLVTEFGIAGQQATCLQKMAAMGVTEPTYLYSYRARDAQAQPQYDLAGVELTPIHTIDFASQGVNEGGKTEMSAIVDAIPELRQGPTKLCWAECVQEAFAGAGKSVSVYDLYKQVKGVDYTPPGEPATFGELIQAVQAAATLTGATIKWFGDQGRVNDFATFDQILRDGSWIVVVGANEQVLVNDLGLAEAAGYGHYFICRHIDFDGNGQPDTYTIDSYRAYDDVPVRVPLAAVHDAMRQNWDANYDALAFQVS